MKLLLVNMPCSSVRPSLGLGLLKARLSQDGHDVSVFNANIDFARRVGVGFYHYLTELAPVEALLGEYLFSHRVFPGEKTAYLDFLISNFRNECPPGARELLPVAREQVDPFLAECLEVIGRDDYELVGFSSSFSQNMASLALAQMVKARDPDVLVAMGGANCEDLMGLALHRSFSFLDLVFCGEADVSLPRAVEALAAGQALDSIEGLIWRDPEGGSSEYASLSPPIVQSLDELPYPDYDDFFEQCAQLPPGSRIDGVPMETSRGELSTAFRAKDPERVLAELVYLRDRYDVEDIQIVDDVYEAETSLTWEQLADFRSAGVRSIRAGVEGLGVRSIELLKQCREVGIWPHWNLLYGCPDESVEAHEQIATKIEFISHLDPPDVCRQFRLDRFDPLFVRANGTGVDAIGPAKAYELLYELPTESLQALAYYFDFERENGDDPAAYARSLRVAVKRWRQRAGDLTFTEEDGVIRVVDSRGGKRREVLLEGAERDLYRSCARAVKLSELEEEFSQRLNGNLREVLDRWRGDRLMIELDGRYLALAVDGTSSGLLSASRGRRGPKAS